VKLTKEIFTALEAEKSRLEKDAYAAETAISALQALCDHDWVEDICHGYGEDPPHCAICGIIKN